VLTQVADCRPPANLPNRKTNSPEVIGLHKALADFIVKFPRGVLVPDKSRQTLRPLVEQFGPPTNSFDDLARCLCDRIVTLSSDDPDWKLILQAKATAAQRIGGDGNYQTLRNTRVKEFASLILRALPPDEAPEPATAEIRDVRVSIQVELHLNVATNGTAMRPRLSGDLQRWYVGVLQPNLRKHALAETVVSLVHDSDDHSAELAGQGVDWDPINHRNWVEREIVSRYDASVQNVVRDICATAIQWFRGHYDTPEWVGTAVSLVLESVWNPAVADPSVCWLEAHHFLSPFTRVQFPIPKSRLQEWAVQQRANPDRLDRYVEKVLRSMMWLDDDVMRALACPALIDRWLQHSIHDERLREEDFFNIPLWKLRLRLRRSPA